MLGHADERASDAYNLGLSSKRAQSVANYLENLDIQSVKVEQSYYGERVPAALGSNPASWKRNRRVDVIIQDYAAVIPSCPGLFDTDTRSNANTRMDGLGCANAANLAVMVADPADLYHERPVLPGDFGHADATVISGAVDRYRTDKVKALGDAGGAK